VCTILKRLIPFPNALGAILKDQIEFEIKKHAEQNKEFDREKGLIFSSEACGFLDSRNLGRSFKRLLKRLDINYKSFHKLRHTYATKLFEQGVPLETVNVLLGHNGDKAITKIYIHITSANKKQAIEKINHIFES
jgi:site-specific recombinase XerD